MRSAEIATLKVELAAAHDRAAAVHAAEEARRFSRRRRWPVRPILFGVMQEARAWRDADVAAELAAAAAATRVRMRCAAFAVAARCAPTLRRMRTALGQRPVAQACEREVCNLKAERSELERALHAHHVRPPLHRPFPAHIYIRARTHQHTRAHARAHADTMRHCRGRPPRTQTCAIRSAPHRIRAQRCRYGMPTRSSPCRKSGASPTSTCGAKSSTSRCDRRARTNQPVRAAVANGH